MTMQSTKQSTQNQQEISDFINSLELPPVHPVIARLANTAKLAAADPPPTDKPSANIDAGSLVSFTANVSDQHRSDALNSTLLAQLNSDKLFNRFDPAQVIPWYQNYTTVLSKIGWDMQEFDFVNYQASGSTFSIDQSIIQILASFLTAPELAVEQAALTALENLKTDDPWYTVWDQQSHSANGGNFQLASCTDNNGAENTLVIKMSAYSFSTTETTTRFLWTNYSSSDTQLHYANETATLDEDVYTQVRQQIIDKLGDKAKTFVGSLDI